MASLFRQPIRNLRGVGAKSEELFRKLDIDSIGALLYHFPRDYEDWTNPAEISNGVVGEVCCIKAKLSAQMRESRLAGNRYLVNAEVSDGRDVMRLVFFNNRYITSMLKYDTQYIFRGKLMRDFGGLQMVSPVFIPADSEKSGLHPVYRLTAGLSNNQIQRAVREALKLLPSEISDPLPEEIRRKYDLCSLKEAIENIHFPKDRKSLQKARKRLTVEELLVLNLGIRALKNHEDTVSNVKLEKDFTEEFLKLLPFILTGAQMRVINECTRDMQRGKNPMNRLVQGDVGSGKTAVAAAACYNVVKNGYQAAFMAPTEILAEQHYKTLSKYFENTDVKLELLTGSLSASKKKEARQRMAEGKVNLVVGTHALITEQTVFKNLGLAITDEQHRFGVSQRSKLLAKGDSPHLLVMSATPIPRTLALIIYGDLDISVIDETPPGRSPVKTMFITGEKRHRAFDFIKEEMDRGNRAYIVCPLVSEDEQSELAAAEEYAAELMLKEFSDYPVGIIHGKMKYAEKEKAMTAFLKGETKLLVATTVIEVGVDVPEATVMMIENAERFGLSQLHQLRGRVGRGKEKSYCILLSDAQGEKTQQRLSVMCKTTDGFRIADEDLRQRGPGDFFGERQHGLPKLNIADFSDMDGVTLSQKIAEEIVADSPDLSSEKYRGLRASIRRLFSSTDARMN
ncbi:MAG: ATP-dependent DNA helicase RecG [Eubacteriales bacterium]|nr:ATP-dependent DNA helicase RecG [Eubacteriales bacterium]